MIIKEDYPETFEWDVFENLPSYAKRLAYANERLEKLGSGSARTVYAIDDKKVLKVAKNSKGLSQNRQEIQMKNDYCAPDILAEIFESSDSDKFLEMERGSKVSKSDFKRLTGVSLEAADNYLDYFSTEVLGQRRGQAYLKRRKPENYDELCENEFLQGVTDLAGNWGFPLPGDFNRLSTYGKSKRSSGEQIIIVDFGFYGDAVKLY
jgi:hypothetical protein